MSTPLIDVRGLHMAYGANHVLSGIDFSVGRGEVVGLLGPNGAGKTTTMDILEGFRRPSSGEVSVLGEAPISAGESWRARVGIVQQSWRDHAKWRVEELLDYLGSGRGERDARAVRGPPGCGVGPGGGAMRNTLRSAWVQARIDLRTTILTPEILLSLSLPIVLLVISWFLRDSLIDESTVSVAQLMVPSMLGAMLLLGGFSGVAGELYQERDQGTILRMKCVPRGLTGYLTGKTISTTLTTFLLVGVTLVLGSLLFEGVGPSSLRSWVLLAAFGILGMAATVPWGAIVGAAIKTPIGLMLPILGVYGLLIVSGVFFPITVFPVWVQVIVQALPAYWLALGMRAALLPDAAAVIEIGGSWRLVETFAVLGVWAVVGLLLAPIVLRRMIRGESGSKVTAARERLLTPGY